MELIYKKERDIDFYSVCERIRREKKTYLSVCDIADRARLRPAESYYLSVKEYSRIIARMKSGRTSQGISKEKRDLYIQIFEIYQSLTEENPKLSIMAASRKISEMKAPRFYISGKTAANLYYQLLKQKIQ